MLAKILPGDLVARERKEIRIRTLMNVPENPSYIKKDERNLLLTLWQERWESTDKGAWTRRLGTSKSKTVACSESSADVSDHRGNNWTRQFQAIPFQNESRFNTRFNASTRSPLGYSGAHHLHLSQMVQ